MENVRTASLALAILTSASLSSFAQTNFVANLTPGQESPPTSTPVFTMSGGGARPESFGNATLVLSADMSQLSMTIMIFNIDVNGTQTPGDANDNLAAAHIHAAAPTGTNASVVWGFFGTPDNDTTPSDLVVTPFAMGVGGTFTTVWNMNEGNGSNTLTSRLNDIMNGLAYLNFHTAQNGGGEIRGQIVIPEPSTTALLGVALIGGAAALWRRRR